MAAYEQAWVGCLPATVWVDGLLRDNSLVFSPIREYLDGLWVAGERLGQPTAAALISQAVNSSASASFTKDSCRQLGHVWCSATWINNSMLVTVVAVASSMTSLCAAAVANVPAACSMCQVWRAVGSLFPAMLCGPAPQCWTLTRAVCLVA